MQWKIEKLLEKAVLENAMCHLLEFGVCIKVLGENEDQWGLVLVDFVSKWGFELGFWMKRNHINVMRNEMLSRMFKVWNDSFVMM